MNDRREIELRSLMERAVLQSHIATAVAEVASRRSEYQVDERKSFTDRAALQDSIDEVAAGIAREADRIGRAAWAEIFWTLVRTSRVNAMNLRARASR